MALLLLAVLATRLDRFLAALPAAGAPVGPGHALGAAPARMGVRPRAAAADGVSSTSAITGQLISRVTNDTEAVKTLYIQVLFVILDSSIVLVGTMAAMAWLDWRLMLIVLALVPAVVLIIVAVPAHVGAGGDHARAPCAATSTARWPNRSAA